jgi:hypothetical protein
MTVTFVTAFYVLPNTVRGVTFYLERLEELIKTGVPLVLYLDATLETEGRRLTSTYTNVSIPKYVTLDTSWVPENVSLPQFRAEEKDTVGYFCIQLQKLWCLTDAAAHTTTTHTAWIDTGIFYMFESKEEAKKHLNEIAAADWPSEILAPGSYDKKGIEGVWELNKHIHYLDYVYWNYLGSFLLGPKFGWADALEEQTSVVKKHLPKLAWEVNYWSKMDAFTWYYADHNLSILVNALKLQLPKPTTT